MASQSGQVNELLSSLRERARLSLRPYATFKRNLRVGNGNNAVIISPGVGNHLNWYIKEGHSRACIPCHIHEIYGFRLQEQVLNDFMNDKWKLTDEKAYISGVQYNNEEIPVGLLRKAVDLRNKGFSLEFCFKHFLMTYDIDISTYCLEEATHAFCDVTGEVKLFEREDETGADPSAGGKQQQNYQELQVQRESPFEGPPAYISSLSSGDADSEASTLQLSGSQLADAGYGNNRDDIILRSSSDQSSERVDNTSPSHGSSPLTSSNHSEHSQPFTNQVGSNDTNVPSSSHLFTRLHSLRMKMAKRLAR